uniref:NADH-ubiquinone oxidoreductase chain 6 n=1 Tax=Entiminae sp. ACP-2013 TaxID=2480628 RepID=A0A3G5FNX5_9CUCU|nr:NADH dehydrogenase subunit 6 [Entiminae sp. ACP-2013]
MLLYFITLSWMLSFMFIFLSHPLSLGFTLLLQTIMASLILGNLNLNFWFSYILFLIMIGGMLVLFIYMTSIASDEKFNFSKNFMIMYIMLMMFYFIMLSSDSFFFYSELMNSDLLKTNINSEILSMNKLTNKFNWMVFFILIWYLLVTLITIVKIAYSKMGTLRPKSL